jgi:hypothetical protein
MPDQAVASTRTWNGHAAGKRFWNRLIETAIDPQFISVCLLSITGFLLSLALAILVRIPEAEALLSIPG